MLGDLLLGYYITPGVALFDLLLWYHGTTGITLVDLLLWYHATSIQNANNDNIHIITRQSKTSVCLSKVTINMITLLSVIIPYFQFSLLPFSFLLLFCVTVADCCYPVWALWLYCSNNCTWLCNLSIVSIPGEGYSRNASCPLSLISTFYSLVFVFVPCFASPVLPVALDYLFLQDCTFLVLYNSYFHSHLNPLFHSNFHVRQTLKLIE